jgi:hypothetical protein
MFEAKKIIVDYIYRQERKKKQKVTEIQSEAQTLFAR